MGKTQSENCQICNVCDFIYHFFFSCLAVKHLWNFIESRLHVKLVVTDVNFGFQNNNRNYDVLNKLILIAKLCISKFKYYDDYNDIIILFKQQSSYRNIKW